MEKQTVMTASEYQTLYNRLCAEHCLNLKNNGFLGIWPDFLKWGDIQRGIEAGYITRKFYKYCYGHEDYYFHAI